MVTATALAPAGELTDLVDQYSTPLELPSAEWLKRLQLEEPRRNVQSLGLAARFGKRLTDVVVAASLLVLLSPVMLLVALLVRCTSPGPVIFRQVRTGLNKRATRRDRRLRRG